MILMRVKSLCHPFGRKGHRECCTECGKDRGNGFFITCTINNSYNGLLFLCSSCLIRLRKEIDTSTTKYNRFISSSPYHCPCSTRCDECFKNGTLTHLGSEWMNMTLCPSCLATLRTKIDALSILVQTGIDTKETP